MRRPDPARASGSFDPLGVGLPKALGYSAVCQVVPRSRGKGLGTRRMKRGVSSLRVMCHRRLNPCQTLDTFDWCTTPRVLLTYSSRTRASRSLKRMDPSACRSARVVRMKGNWAANPPRAHAQPATRRRPERRHAEDPHAAKRHSRSFELPSVSTNHHKVVVLSRSVT